MKHLPVGGSTATRTLNCPGWIEKSKGIPRRPAGQAALNGSMHHEVQQMCREQSKAPADFIGHVYTEDTTALVFGDDDLDLSQIAFDATETLLNDLDIDEMMIEPFVQLIPDEAGGSIDLLGLSHDRKTLLILDYKFGSYKVDAKENVQGLFYAACVEADVITYDLLENVDEIVIAIIQPKIKGTVSTWSCDRKTLTQYLVRLKTAIVSTDINPGSHCKWCPAEPYCVEKKAAVMSATLLDKDSHNELSAAAAEVERVESWVKAVKEELYVQISRGVSIPGWKVVDKRATRKWSVDDGEIMDTLDDAGIDFNPFIQTKVLTPAQMEKALKKNKVDIDLSEFIIKTSTGTTLAQESDSREAVVVTDVTGHLAEMMDR
jgi:hypothetical protein